MHEDHVDILRAMFFQDVHGMHHGSTGVDLIIDQEDILAFDIADDRQGFRVGDVGGPFFLDECQAGVQ